MTLYDVPYRSLFRFRSDPDRTVYFKTQGDMRRLYAGDSAYSTWDGTNPGERVGSELLYARCDTPVYVTNFRGQE